MPIKVILYEDNEVMREGLAKIIAYSGEYLLCGAFENCNHVDEQIKTLSPDLILMDIEMPGTNGIEGILRIRKIDQAVRIIILTVFDDNKNVFDAICAGANGYLLKKTVPEKIFDAMQDVLNGGSPMTAAIASKVLALLAGSKPAVQPNGYNLTKREKDILQSMVEGNSYKMIASDLFISQDTVKTHIKHIYEKLQVHSQTEAVVKALNEKLL